MSAARSFLFLSRRASASATTTAGRLMKTKTTQVCALQNVRCFATSGLPDSIKRVGETTLFPNEYPGQNYDFNWALNYDGVTPIKKAAFRITKPLDLKIAGLTPLATSPLKVNAATERGLMSEAGSSSLPFETFDELSQRTKDLLSISDKLYCPEGHAPSSRVGVRIITNSATLAPKLLAYLERMPKRDPAPQPITVFALEESDSEIEAFSGYAIEEIEEPSSKEIVSVASVIAVGKTVKLETVVAGIELSVGGLLEDEKARKEEAEEKAKAEEKAE